MIFRVYYFLFFSTGPVQKQGWYGDGTGNGKRGKLSMMVYPFFAPAVKSVTAFCVYLYSIMPVSYYYFPSFSQLWSS